MCGRFSLDPANWEISALLKSLPAEFPDFRTGEVYPGNTCLGFTGANGSVAPNTMVWGFPTSRGRIINARSETAVSKPLFAESLASRRVALPSSGFYEWVPTGEKKKEKFLFQTSPESILWLAGIWKTMPDALGNLLPHFTILTQPASEFMRPYHHRMPLILTDANMKNWLAGAPIGGIQSQTPQLTVKAA